MGKFLSKCEGGLALCTGTVETFFYRSAETPLGDFVYNACRNIKSLYLTPFVVRPDHNLRNRIANISSH